MKKRTTIYDVAEHAGTSITTVSRFLNSPDRVASDTRARISMAMEQLEFVPKADAMARARKGIRRIGVLAPFFTEPSFSQRLRGVQSALSSSAYDLIIYAVESEEQFKGYLSMLPVSGRIDGVIIISLPFHYSDLTQFRRHRIPVVSIEYGCDGVSSIEIDNYQAGVLAAKYLSRKGYNSFGFIGDHGQPNYILQASTERLKGFSAELQRLGTPLRDEAILLHETGLDGALRSAESMVTLAQRPRAVFCASDLEAVVLLKVAREHAVHIPGDLAVLGIDDIELANFMGLTTIRQDLDHAGRLAALKLLDLMKYPGSPSARVRLNLHIAERDTV